MVNTEVAAASKLSGGHYACAANWSLRRMTHRTIAIKKLKGYGWSRRDRGDNDEAEDKDATKDKNDAEDKYDAEDEDETED